MAKWKASGTRYVRYYEHGARKHGLREDRYYAIRYQVNGKRKEEGHKSLKEIRPEDAERMFDQMKSEGLSPRTSWILTAKGINHVGKHFSFSSAG